MTKVATMECLSESKENVGLFWSFLNSALKQYTGNNEFVFKPHLYVFDEGGGFGRHYKITLDQRKLKGL